MVALCKFLLDTYPTKSYIINITKRQHGARQMDETLTLVRKIYGHTANTSRATEIAIREADLATKPKGFVSTILSFFGD